jgi:hypothetical protein
MAMFRSWPEDCSISDGQSSLIRVIAACDLAHSDATPV